MKRGESMDIDLLKRLGNMDQIAGIREMEYTCGNEKGLGAIEVYNAAGLRFTVIPDRCMDIYDCSFKGCNLSFHSKNGLSGLRDSAEDEFFHQWPGGMLFTSGLANVGNACIDGGVHPIHGRIGSTPARHVSAKEGWENNDYILSVSGEVWETRLYGRQISLFRTISTSLYSKTITITDTVTNHGSGEEEYMLLYHMNFGYPLLDASSMVVSSADSIQPRNEHSVDYIHMNAPDAKPSHQTFLHTMGGSQARAGVINESLCLAAYIEFETKNLPYLNEWKNLAGHDYVVALEPANCTVLGRIKERDNGTLKTFPPYSSITNTILFGILDDKAEIEAFKQTCGQ
ncbi:MAG: aldose 1-epimerase family protein [Bacillota bacterium]|nr:aldose 1-epimerase family protein [Bacillota bacterium]